MSTKLDEHTCAQKERANERERERVRENMLAKSIKKQQNNNNKREEQN